MKPHLLAFVAACLLWALPASAQVFQTAYAEVEVDKKVGTDFKVLLDRPGRGVLCYLEGESHERNNQKELRLRYYGDTLQLLWEKTYLIPYSEKLLYEHCDNGQAYFLAQQREDEYRVLRIGLDTGGMMAVPLTPIKNFFITHFKVHDGQIIVGGRVNNHPLATVQPFREGGTPVVLSSITQLDAELLEMSVDSLRREVYVLLEKEKPASETALYVNRYALEGNLLSNYEVRLPNDYRLQSFRPVPQGQSDALLLLGTYGLGSDAGAQGVYSLQLREGEVANSRFYDFGYLKNFFSYLPEKPRARKIRKVKALLDGGKRMRHRFKLFVHPLQFHRDRILLIAESYDASSDYRQNPWDLATGYGSWYDPSMRRYMNLLGYQGFMPMSFSQSRWRDRSNFPTEFEYRHAFVLGFDAEGSLVWDNSYNFPPKTKSAFPVEQAQALAKDDTVVIMQVTEEELYFKASFRSQYQEGNDTLAIPPARPGDDYEGFEQGGMLYWFEEHVLASGIRQIRNRESRENKRHVFFLSRYSYAPGLREEVVPAEEEKKP